MDAYLLMIRDPRVQRYLGGGVNVFDGEPQARMDSDGRAHPYAAVYVTQARQSTAPSPHTPGTS